MEILKLIDDVFIGYDSTTKEIIIAVEQINNRLISITFNSEELDKLIPWLQNKRAEM